MRALIEEAVQRRSFRNIILRPMSVSPSSSVILDAGDCRGMCRGPIMFYWASRSGECSRHREIRWYGALKPKYILISL